VAIIVHGSLLDPRPASRRIVTDDGGASLREVLERLGAIAPGEDFAEPTLVVVDGVPIMRPSWDVEPVRSESIVNVWTLPQGGGRGGKNPLAMVLMLAAAIAIPAIGIGAGAAGAAGLTASTTAFDAATGLFVTTTSLTAGGTMLAGAINAGLMVGASMGINLLLGQSLPKEREVSPNYSLTARGNRARLGECIPVQYGRVLRYPEFASAPWSEFSYSPGQDDRGQQFIGEQTLYVLFCLGWGSYDVEEYRLLGTDISTYEEVTVEKYEPGQPVTLFPTAVVTNEAVVSIELDAPDSDLETDTKFSTVDYTGTVTGYTAASGGSGTISDSGQTWTVNGLVGSLVTFPWETTLSFDNGDGDGVSPHAVSYIWWATITANTATQITYDAPVGSHLEAAATSIGAAYAVVTPQNWQGPYQVNSGDEPQVNAIGVDIVFPYGLNTSSDVTGNPLMYAVGVRLEYRETDSAGTPTGEWLQLGDYDGGYGHGGFRRALANTIPCNAGEILRWENKSGLWKPPAGSKYSAREHDAMDATWAWYDDTERPLRDSQKFSVAPGYYQIRVRRVTGLGADKSNVQQLAQWAGVRGYGYDVNNVWQDKTIIAVKLQASDNVNSSTVQDFGVLCTRKLQDYLGGATWSAERASRRISTAMIDMVQDANYGLGQTLSADALEELWALEQTWQGRDAGAETPVLDCFDGVFDTARGFWGAINAVARVGRSRCFWPQGELTVIRDEARASATSAFNATNIARGSFGIDYSFPTPTSPDYVIVEFFNEATWQDDEVECSELAVEDPTWPGLEPARIRLFGIVQRQQAWREGMYELGVIKRRRRMIGLTTDAEGYLPFFGDLVEVTHEVPGWGQSGRITGYDEGETTSTLFTSEPLTWTEGASHVVQLKNHLGVPDATHGLIAVSRGSTDNAMLLTGAVAADIRLHTADQFLREATHYSFGVIEQNRKQCIVAGIVPRGPNSVELMLNNYVVTGVYDNDDDANYIPPTQAELLSRETPAPTVTGLHLWLSGFAGSPFVHCSWLPAGFAKYYVVDMSLDGSSWRRVGRTVESSLAFRAPSVTPTRFLVDVGGIDTVTVKTSASTGVSRISITRDVSGDPDPWVTNAFFQKQILFVTGVLAGQLLDISSNSANSLVCRGKIIGPPAHDDEFEIVSYGMPTLYVGVRAVNRLMGPRTSETVELSAAAVLPTPGNPTSVGELAVTKNIGSTADAYAPTPLWRFDSEGNLLLAGTVISTESNADLAAWTVGDVALATDGVSAYLPAAPAGDDYSRVLIFSDGALLRLVTPPAGAGEWEAVSGNGIMLGFDGTGLHIWAVMLAAGASADLDGMQLGVECTFDSGVSTEAFTLPVEPIDETEVLIFHNGVACVPVGSTPGANEFSLTGLTHQDGTIGNTLTNGDHLVAVYVAATASAAAQRLRVAPFDASTLPMTPLHADRLLVATTGTVLAQSSIQPIDGEFRVSGSPPTTIDYGPAGVAGDLQYVVGIDAVGAAGTPTAHATGGAVVERISDAGFNGVTTTFADALSSVPETVSNDVLAVHSGVGVLKRVIGSPAAGEFAVSGRDIEFGAAPEAGDTVVVSYVIADATAAGVRVTQPFIRESIWYGTYAANEELFYTEATIAYTIPGGFSGSDFGCRSAPADGPVDMRYYVGGVNILTVTLAQTTGAVTLSAPVLDTPVAIGDGERWVAPSTPDSAFAGFWANVVGVRT